MSVIDILTNLTENLPNTGKNEVGEDEISSTNFAKIITIFALFVISMSSGMIPKILSKKFNWSDPNRDPRTNLVISSLLSFGGGALLCTTLMHLLPEIDESISELQAEGHLPSWDFSITNLLMATGFFIIYFVEEIVHLYLRRHQKKQAQAQEAFVRGHSARESLRDANTRRVIEKQNDKSRISAVSTADLVDNEQVENGLGKSNHKKPCSSSCHSTSSAYHGHSHHHQHSSHHSHSHIQAIDGNSILVSSIRGLLIVMALSVHELFEGLAVGLEESSSNVWYMFGSVSAHKVVIAFCIGVELMVHKTKTWLVITYIFVYAIVSPIGIGIGIGLSNVDDSDGVKVASVSLQGLASGTLLYVIFFEILSKHKDGFVQYAAVLVGFFLMFGLQFVAGHSHSHGEDGHTDDGHSHGHSHNLNRI